MKHIFYPVEESQGTLISLHGTGGDEDSLLSIAKSLSSNMNYLAYAEILMKTD